MVNFKDLPLEEQIKVLRYTLKDGQTIYYADLSSIDVLQKSIIYKDKYYDSTKLNWLTHDVITELQQGLDTYMAYRLMSSSLELQQIDNRINEAVNIKLTDLLTNVDKTLHQLDSSVSNLSESTSTVAKTVDRLDYVTDKIDNKLETLSDFKEAAKQSLDQFNRVITGLKSLYT